MKPESIQKPVPCIPGPAYKLLCDALDLDETATTIDILKKIDRLKQRQATSGEKTRRTLKGIDATKCS